MALSNDFFGMENLGYDPSHQAIMDRLEQYSAIQQSFGGGGGTTQGGVSSPSSSSLIRDPDARPRPRPRGPGRGGGSRQNPNPGHAEDCPGLECPEGQNPHRTPGGDCVCQDLSGDSGGGGGGGGSSSTTVNNLYTDENIPADIRNLRVLLGRILSERVDEKNPGLAVTNVPDSPYLGQAAGAAARGVDDANDVSRLGLQGLSSLLGFNPTADLSGILGSTTGAVNAGPQTQGLGFLSATGSPFSDLLVNGGAPDITNALNAIRTKGMQDIEDSNAQLREQFGTYGLGQSSDVNEALARGTSRGIADIVAQQSTLATSVLGDAQNRRLSAIGLAPSLAASAASPFESDLTRRIGGAGTLASLALSPADQLRQNAAIRSQVLASLPGIQSATMDPYFKQAGLLTSLATIDQGNAFQNAALKNQSEQLKLTYPNMEAALAMATGQVPSSNKPFQQDNTGSWLSMIGAIGSAALLAI